jgi:hypothetical protein
MDLGARALELGLRRRREGVPRSRVAPIRAVMDSADARRSAGYSRTWARWLGGRVSRLMEPQRARAQRMLERG